MTSCEGLGRADRLRKCAFLFAQAGYSFSPALEHQIFWFLDPQKPTRTYSISPTAQSDHPPTPARYSQAFRLALTPPASLLLQPQTAYHGTPASVIVLTNSRNASPHIYSYPIGSVLWRTLTNTPRLRACSWGTQPETDGHTRLYNDISTVGTAL